jgi:hypothetical protein
VQIREAILADGRHVPIHIDRETLHNGSLAYQWFPHE